MFALAAPVFTLRLATQLAWVTAGFPASPSPGPSILPGRMDAVAATDVGIIVASGSTVWVLDPHGSIVRTLWPQRPPPLRPVAVRAPAAVPGLTADSGWAPPYDPDDVEPQDDPGLVDDDGARGFERSRRGRRRRQPDRLTSGGSGSWMAAGGDHGWVGRGDGVWRIDLRSGDAACVLGAPGGGIRAVASSTDGRTIAVVDGGRVLRSRNAGLVFEEVGAAPTRPGAIAATDGGDLLFLDGGGVSLLRAGAPERERLPVGGAVALAACGHDALIVAPGALYLLSTAAASLTHNPMPPGAQMLACGAAGTGWWTRGAGLWASSDWGLSWSLQGDLPPAQISSLAANRDGAWLATSAGLMAVPQGEHFPGTGTPPGTHPGAKADTTTTTLRHAAVQAGSLGWDPPSEPPSSRWWHGGLPRLDVSFATGRTASRRDVRAFVMATFVLGPRRPPSSTPSAISREFVRRRLADEQARVVWLRQAAAAAASPDTLTAEEARALLRVLQDGQTAGQIAGQQGRR